MNTWPRLIRYLVCAIYAGALLGVSGSRYTVGASDTSTLSQQINAGVLSVDIVDGSYATVGNPAVSFTSKSTSASCYSGGSASTGTLGVSGQRIYVDNPDQADNGWSVTIAASAPTATWDTGSLEYDFNDAGGSGCNDGGDSDNFAGQLSVNPAAGSLAVGQCTGCTTTGVSLGTSSSFVEGSVNNITIVSASAGANDVADYVIQGVALSQTIPAGQAAGTYTIDLTLSIVAN